MEESRDTGREVFLRVCGTCSKSHTTIYVSSYYHMCPRTTICVLIPEIVQNNRDHRAVLELPVNLHQLSKEKQCSYVKKAHKALARKWHPDKVCTRAQRDGQRERDRETETETETETESTETETESRTQTLCTEFGDCCRQGAINNAPRAK